MQSTQRPFWQKRYHDFNVYTPDKFSEKIHYMHENPVRRGLVTRPKEWSWSSCYHYATTLPGMVEIESDATAARRQRPSIDQATLTLSS